MTDDSTSGTADNSALARQFSLAIKASDELLQLASSERWQDFERQFRQRDALLQRIDAEVTGLLPLSEQDSVIISEKLKQLRELNDQILTVAERSKSAALGELAKDRSARKALAAYNKP
ncbi:flagellar protein FliT [Gilvimarinus agarilyticus]|uniref:flagellar protein FliT n=1 Tax=Gilvimarinus agarilyticus TaxID=679259 RepID=UPI00059FEDBC|nr:flagellar protein FliT [Gilvimarinus agarilyticus]